MKSDAFHGTLLTCKTRKQHGLGCPWECPLMGIAGTAKRIQPILDFRAAHERVDGPPSVLYVSENQSPMETRKRRCRPPPPPYSSTRRKLAILCTSLGDSAGGSYNLHSLQKPSPNGGKPDELQPEGIEHRRALAQ